MVWESKGRKVRVEGHLFGIHFGSNTGLPRICCLDALRRTQLALNAH